MLNEVVQHSSRPPSRIPAVRGVLVGTEDERLVRLDVVGEHRILTYWGHRHSTERYPRAGSQSYPSPAAEASADGSTRTNLFRPKQPDGVKRAATGSRPFPVRAGTRSCAFTSYSPLEPFLHEELAAE